MTVRAWAIKPGELKPLARDGLVALAARCAMRVEPWVPSTARAPWRAALALVTGAVATPLTATTATAQARAISDLGARAHHRLAATDAVGGSCANYATQTLAAALAAAAAADRAAALAPAILAARMSASIGPVLAHAGRVQAPAGGDPVELAALASWDAIRADVPALATALPAILRARDTSRAIRAAAPPWPAGAPSWAASGARTRGRRAR